MVVKATGYLECIARLISDAFAPCDGVDKSLLRFLVDIHIGHSAILIVMTTSELAETGAIDIVFL